MTNSRVAESILEQGVITLTSELERVQEELRIMRDALDHVRSRSPGRSHARSMRDIALALAELKGEFSMDDVVQAAKTEGSRVQYGSLSSVIAKLVRQGVLRRGQRRGWYTLSPNAGAETANGEIICPVEEAS